MTKLVRAQLRRDDGFILATSGLLLVSLLVIAALAIDVGAWYSRGAQLQRAADAAALAGVVWMPDLATATSVAQTTASKNGFTNGTNGITVAVAPVTGNSHQLQVTITDSNVPRYFSQMFISNQTISKSATAEYLLPIPLGSPDNKLGNQSNTDTQNLWASVSAPYTDYNNGDPYDTKCLGGTSGTSCGNGNVGKEYRNTGFMYSIEVPSSAVGQTLTVKVFDAGNYARANYANVETADQGTVNTEYELFKPTSTPLDSSTYTDPSLSMNGKCTSGAGRWIIQDSASASTYENLTQTLCATPAVAGIYHLQVKTSNIPGITDAGNGWNQFSLVATLGGSTQPKLYGYQDLSLFNNLPNQSGNLSATFYLASVDNIYAGKQLQINMFDPGDGASGNYFVNFLQPGGTTFSSCSYGVPGGSFTVASPCRIQTRNSSAGTPNQYNGKWLNVLITLPSNYTCASGGTDCWWKVKYDFNNVSAGASPNDRTVWSANILNSPVHLVK